MKGSKDPLKRRTLHVGGVAKLDLEREFATGIPEVILAKGKSPEDVELLARRLLEKKGRVIVTKAGEGHFERLEGIEAHKNLNRKAGTAILKKEPGRTAVIGRVGLLAAGTSDIPVAEEARLVLEELGCAVITGYDVGVAGLHRVFPCLERMAEEDADVAIVVAGMEGALPSVVKGLVDIPVIGVPTSVGYGYGGGGESALMAMLQSCSPGVTVVNIDNGFGAAAAAYLICRRISMKKRKNHGSL
ncbi:MAG: nickel pincer cofactor biosynthesis protein LarB [Methanobacteriota archaeon]|nr:MAG: nickel pincer cofactor biosynthesis protein LarB [Euryarchaeota archaeon]